MSKQRCLNKFLFKSVSSKIYDALAKSFFPSTVYKIDYWKEKKLKLKSSSLGKQIWKYFYWI